jgi:hypothetical protein
MQEIMSQYATPLMVALLAIMVGTIFWSFRERLRFWWMDCLYAVPFIGKLNGLSRDTSQSAKSGWLIAEETLCADYKQHINPLSESEFHKRTEYMRKSNDIGRSPMSGGMFFALGVLLAAEALGFSYLLGVWMAQEGSANLHTVMSFAISFVIATILAILTHNAGHQLYTRRLISGCEKEWRDMGQKTELVDGVVKLDADQSVDDNKPTYTQTIARTGRDKGFGWIAAAIIAVALICLGSTYMRMQNLRANMIQDNVGSSEASNPFANGDGLPEDIAKPQEAADNKAKVEKMEAEKGEGYAAFIMLGAIFVFTQVVGAFTGFKYGFAAREGKAAYNSTLGCTTFEDYMSIFEPRVHKAQSRLRNLQQLVAKRSESRAVHTKGDFIEYQSRIRDEQAKFRRAGSTMNRDVQSPQASAQAAVPIVPEVRQTHASASEEPVDQASKGINLQAALAHLDGLPNADEKRAFTLSLPEPLRSEVIAEVQRLKSDGEARAAAAIKDLF